MNIYFWLWWSLTTIQQFVLAWATTKCFVSKVKTSYSLAVFTAVIIIPFMLSLLGEPWSYFKPLACIVLPIAVTCWLFKGSKVAICLFFVFNQMLDFMVEIILTVFVQWLDPSFITSDLEIYSEPRIICTLLYSLIALPMKYIYCQVWNRLVNKVENVHTKPIYVLFPLGQAIVIFCVMYQRLAINGLFGFSAVTVSMIGFTILAISDVIFLIYLTDIEKSHVLKQEYDRMQFAYNLEQEHYQSIESKRYEIAKIRHDIKNQLISVKQLVETKNYEEAQELISGIEKNLDSTAEYKYCSIPVINAVVHQKRQLCVDNDIRFEADITVEEIGRLEQVHLCSIFSNLLDNSINANKKLPEDNRYIKLFAQNKQGHIVISTENPAPDDKTKHIDPMHSSGYGLKILKDISERYSGHFKISCEGNACRAAISVCIEDD